MQLKIKKTIFFIFIWTSVLSQDLTNCIIYQYKGLDSLNLDTCLLLQYNADKLTNKKVLNSLDLGHVIDPISYEIGSETSYSYNKSGRLINQIFRSRKDFEVKKIKIYRDRKIVTTVKYQNKEIRITDPAQEQQDEFEVKISKRRYFNSKTREIYRYNDNDSVIELTEKIKFSRFKRFNTKPDFITYYSYKTDTVESYRCKFIEDEIQDFRSIVTYRPNGFIRLTSEKFRCLPLQKDSNVLSDSNEFIEPCYLTNIIHSNHFRNYVVTEYYQDPIEKLWFRVVTFTDNKNRPIRQEHYDSEGHILTTRIYKYY